MQIVTQIPVESSLTVSMRTVIAMTTGGVFTFALFVLMNHFIEQDTRPVDPVTPYVHVDPVFKEQEEKLIERETIKPKPETQQIPDIPREMPEESVDPSGTSIAINIPIETGITIAGPDVFGSSDSDVRPLVRVDPRYPIDAARNGIEGWVKMRFDITALGSVSNIRVIEAQPARMFDKEARRALSKWKYKPKMENGSAITQTDQTVMLEFTLADQ